MKSAVLLLLLCLLAGKLSHAHIVGPYFPSLATPDVSVLGQIEPHTGQVNAGYGNGATQRFDNLVLYSIKSLWLAFDPANPPSLSLDGVLDNNPPGEVFTANLTSLGPSNVSTAIQWVGAVRVTAGGSVLPARFKCLLANQTVWQPSTTMQDAHQANFSLAAVPFVAPVSHDFQVSCLFEVLDGGSWQPSAQYYCAQTACDSTLSGYVSSYSWGFYHRRWCDDTFPLHGPAYPPPDPVHFVTFGIPDPDTNRVNAGYFGGVTANYTLASLDLTTHLYYTTGVVPALALDDALDNNPPGEYLVYNSTLSSDDVAVWLGQIRVRIDQSPNVYGPVRPSRALLTVSGNSVYWLPSLGVIPSDDPQVVVNATTQPVVIKLKIEGSPYFVNFRFEVLHENGTWLPALDYYDSVPKSLNPGSQDTRISWGGAFWWSTNDAPNALPYNVSLLSSPSPPTVSLNVTNVGDPDCNMLSLWGVQTPPASLGTVTTLNNTVYFTPAANYVGRGTFNYTIYDGKLLAQNTVTVNVFALSLTTAPVSATVNVPFSSTAWVTAVTPTAADGVDPTTLSVSVTTVNASFFSVQPTVSSLGVLSFTANSTGSTVLAMRLSYAGPFGQTGSVYNNVTVTASAQPTTSSTGGQPQDAAAVSLLPSSLLSLAVALLLLLLSVAV